MVGMAAGPQKVMNKWIYLSVPILLALALVFSVYGYTQPVPDPGHGGDSVWVSVSGQEKTLQDAIDGGDFSVEFETGRVDNGDTIQPISGYQRSECSLILSMEDDHFGTKYGDSFSDQGSWSDNHYGGSQAFYDSNWVVTCRLGFTVRPADPLWYDAKCRYLMICST
jgi:hypothetical protein